MFIKNAPPSFILILAQTRLKETHEGAGRDFITAEPPLWMYPRSSICGAYRKCDNLSILSEDCVPVLPLLSAKLEIRTSAQKGSWWILQMKLIHLTLVPALIGYVAFADTPPHNVIGRFLIAFPTQYYKCTPIFTYRWCHQCFLCVSKTEKGGFLWPSWRGRNSIEHLWKPCSFT